MDERRKQFRVGLVVFATLVFTGVLITVNSNFSFSPFRKQYQLEVDVDQAPGVAPGTPVRRRGVLIGRVAVVRDTDEGAEILVNVNEGKQVKTNERARVQTSLVGDAVVEFVPVGPSAGAQPVQPGGRVKGTYAPGPMDMVANLQGDLQQTIISLGRAGDEVALLAERMNVVLGDDDVERLGRLMASLEEATNQFTTVMVQVDDLLGDDPYRADLREGLAQLPSVVDDTRAILEALQTAVGSADQNLKNLQGLTGPLGERGPEIAASMEKGITSLTELFSQTTLLMRRINESEGTVGKLINDRELYDQLALTVYDVRRMVANLEQMSHKLRPILDDVRVITDKVARDPARITRGIVPGNRETPIK